MIFKHLVLGNRFPVDSQFLVLIGYYMACSYYLQILVLLFRYLKNDTSGRTLSITVVMVGSTY